MKNTCEFIIKLAKKQEAKAQETFNKNLGKAIAKYTPKKKVKIDNANAYKNYLNKGVINGN